MNPSNKNTFKKITKKNSNKVTHYEKIKNKKMKKRKNNEIMDEKQK